MFSYPNVWVMILGVFTGLALIICGVYYMNKILVQSTQDILVKFILLIFTALVGVWVVDKVIAFKISLLNDEQNNQLFELIKTLVVSIFSYYFGSQKANKNEDGN
jgi:hypothetical protein